MMTDMFTKSGNQPKPLSRIRKLLAAFAVVLAGTTITTLGTTGLASANSCGASGGDRTCVDRSDSTAYIYSNNTTVWAQFPVDLSCFGVPAPFTATNANWSMWSNTVTGMWITGVNSSPTCGASGGFVNRVWTEAGSSNNITIGVPSGANHDLFEWFANCCSTHQFTYVN